MERAASAPGKLFLAGEYAVLWGGVARVLAVGPRIFACVRRREDREVHLVLASGRLCGHQTPLGVNWGGPVPEPFRFAAHGIDLALRAHRHEVLGFTLAIAPTPVGPGGQKLGKGSSATAAVLAVELTRFAIEGRFDALRLALLSHHQAQGGRGSGADVAACFAGGLARYRRYSLEPLARADELGTLGATLVEAPPVDLWRAPAIALPLLYAFTGTSASTPSMIDQVQRELTAEQRMRFVLQSDAAGQSLEEALVRGRFDQAREAVRELRSLLRGLGPVETEAAERVLALGESFGCSGKISGAGGGDGCLLVAPDPEARKALVEALEARGFWTEDVHLESGLRGEAQAPAELSAWVRS